MERRCEYRDTVTNAARANGAWDVAVSDAAGHFNLLRVMPGDYELEVPAKYGFEQYEFRCISARRRRIQLTPAAAADEVTVTPPASQVELDPASNRDQVSTDAKMLEKVPVFDQNSLLR
jgi:hypothetical protein